MADEGFFELDKDVNEIRDLLDVLADLMAQRAEITAPFTEQIAELREAMAEATAELDEQIASMRKAVKRAVINHGESVKSPRLHATYVKPRITWDSKRLEGYAEAHPEIKAFRREGKPSVRFTVVE